MRSTTIGSDHDRFRDLCAAYALGALDSPESAEFETHLSHGCVDCSSEIADHRRTITAMGSLLPERIPPPGAAARLFDLIDRGSSSADTRPAGRRAGFAAGAMRKVALAAALLLAVVSLLIALVFRSHVARLEEQIASFESTTDPIVSIIDLGTIPPAAAGRIRVTFDPRNSKWSLFAHDLPAPPAGMIYQGWLLRGGVAHDLGTFLPDASGHGFVSVRLPGSASGTRVQVTLEPARGSDQPQGAIVFSDREGATDAE